jgi:hypothetical protein
MMPRWTKSTERELRTHRVWQNIRHRLCDRWQDYDCFLKEVGEVPAGCGLLSAGPSSVRWTPPAEVVENMRRHYRQ